MVFGMLAHLQESKDHDVAKVVLRSHEFGDGIRSAKSNQATVLNISPNACQQTVSQACGQNSTTAKKKKWFPPC